MSEVCIQQAAVVAGAFFACPHGHCVAPRYYMPDSAHQQPEYPDERSVPANS